MAGELIGTVQAVFEAIDKADGDAATSLITDDAQGIDEISRRWMRGQGEMSGYVRTMLDAATDIHSDVRDAHETVWGDAGVVTFWLEQDYTYLGERVHVSAPTTSVLRREGDRWKIALFHSVPLEPSD
jgi:ketosteroid isomerase-like protein